MFDLGATPPADWEPIPDGVLAELGPLPGEHERPGPGPDAFVAEACARELGTDTLALVTARVIEAKVLRCAHRQDLTAFRAGLRRWLARVGPGFPARARAARAAVGVVVDLPTLLGLREHPAEIPGVGALPAEVARELLAAGAPLRRLVTDPVDGHLLDYGRRTYPVPPALSDYLANCHVRAACPHSTAAAVEADMEHNRPYERGGSTSVANPTPVDRRWHRAKTHGRWRYRKDRNGVVVWTSPSGLSCRIDPYDYRMGPSG